MICEGRSSRDRAAVVSAAASAFTRPPSNSLWTCDSKLFFKSINACKALSGSMLAESVNQLIVHAFMINRFFAAVRPSTFRIQCWPRINHNLASQICCVILYQHQRFLYPLCEMLCAQIPESMFVAAVFPTARSHLMSRLALRSDLADILDLASASSSPWSIDGPSTSQSRACSPSARPRALRSPRNPHRASR